MVCFSKKSILSTILLAGLPTLALASTITPPKQLNVYCVNGACQIKNAFPGKSKLSINMLNSKGAEMGNFTLKRNKVFGFSPFAHHRNNAVTVNYLYTGTGNDGFPVKLELTSSPASLPNGLILGKSWKFSGGASFLCYATNPCSATIKAS